jgi:hypothetical protein
MQIRNKLFCAMIFCAAIFTPRLGATEVVTTSYSAWLATLGNTPTEWNFVFPNGGSYNTASGYSLSVGSYGPVNVTGPDGSGWVLSEGHYGSSNSLTLQGASDGVGSMVFAAPTPGLTGFMLGLGISGKAAPITVTLSDGETFTENPTVGGAMLLGLSSATDITSFTLTTTSGSTVELTDFLAGNSNEPAGTAPAAEVTTALMIGSGLLLFGARRKVFSNRSNSRASSVAQFQKSNTVNTSKSRSLNSQAMRQAIKTLFLPLQRFAAQHVSFWNRA